MTGQKHQLRSHAGTSITKAVARFCCASMPVASHWNKQTGSGFKA